MTARVRHNEYGLCYYESASTIDLETGTQVHGCVRQVLPKSFVEFLIANYLCYHDLILVRNKDTSSLCSSGNSFVRDTAPSRIGWLFLTEIFISPNFHSRRTKHCTHSFCFLWYKMGKILPETLCISSSPNNLNRQTSLSDLQRKPNPHLPIAH